MNKKIFWRHMIIIIISTVLFTLISGGFTYRRMNNFEKEVIRSKTQNIVNIIKNDSRREGYDYSGSLTYSALGLMEHDGVYLEVISWDGQTVSSCGVKPDSFIWKTSTGLDDSMALQVIVYKHLYNYGNVIIQIIPAMLITILVMIIPVVWISGKKRE